MVDSSGTTTHEPSSNRSARPESPRKPRGVLKRMGFAFAASLLSFVLFTGILEIGLRLTGFHYLLTKQVLLRVEKTLYHHLYAYEKNVWFPVPNAGPFNADGLVGPLIPKTREQRTLRIAALGDSCTQYGEPPFSELLREKLNQSWPDPVEVLNAGVAGYSTEMGIARLSRDVLPYRPDIVLIYFGWNDHWIWKPISDRQLVTNATTRDWLWLEPLRGVRVVQAAVWGAEIIREIHPPRNVVRVPLAQYRENLGKLISTVQASGAVPILITAPTDAAPGTPMSELIVYIGGVRWPPDGYDLHYDYVQATRQVARTTGVKLVDAYERFQGKKGLIKADHIHLTPEGADLMATLLAQAVMDTVARPDKE